MIVKAWLTGDEYDLAALARLFGTGEDRVVLDKAGYYLSSPRLYSLDQPEDLGDVADDLLRGINGIGRALVSQFQPVGLEYRFTDGERYRRFISGSFFVRDRKKAETEHADGVSPIAPPRRGPELLRLAAANRDVKELLVLMANSEPLSWVEMWKAYEVVRDAVKPSTIEAQGWTTSAEHGAFRAAANRPDVSGPKARHARMGGSAPRTSMTEEDGRVFLTRIANRWLDSLA